MAPRELNQCWFKSSRSKDVQDCVEVALGENVGVRDTKDRLGGQLSVSAGSWLALVDTVRIPSRLT
jgi:hypothetical protein